MSIQEIKTSPTYSEVRIDSLDDFIKHVTKKIIDKPRCTFIYRGQAHASWGLIPTVQRSLFQQVEAGVKISEGQINTLRLREIELLDEFKRKARPYLTSPPKKRYDWDWLAIAQHHKLPTRLLDWTFHAATALFFAVEDPDIDDEYCAIWCSEAIGEVDIGDPKGPFEVIDLRLYRPPHIAQRISLQNGCFTVHPANYLQQPHKWPRPLEKILLPECKRAITQKMLRKIGVDRSTIFGDLDSIALEIRREFCPW